MTKHMHICDDPALQGSGVWEQPLSLNCSSAYSFSSICCSREGLGGSWGTLFPFTPPCTPPAPQPSIPRRCSALHHGTLDVLWRWFRQLTDLTQDCWDNLGGMLGQCFGHDSVLCERSRGISCISLHIILFRICLDKSGLSIGPCHGHFLLPSWKNRCQVGSGTKSQKMKVLRMAFSIVENVPTPRESIFELFPASQRPYGAKNQTWTENQTKSFINIFLCISYIPCLGSYAGVIRVVVWHGILN